MVANVKLTEKEQSSQATQAIYDDIHATFGVVPAIFKAMGSRPDLLDVTWQRVKTIMTRGQLDRTTTEFIAVAVSATNACDYCVDAHTAMLKHLGASDEQIVEALAVADLFNGLNALASGARIESDLTP